MRNLVITAITATALALPAGMAAAGNGNGNGHAKTKYRAENIRVIGGERHANARHCPPGLAKKNNGCNPPGLVKHRYRVGDHIHNDYVIIRRPGRYGLDPNQSYYRVGNYVYRVDRETREVLDLIGAVAAVLD